MVTTRRFPTITIDYEKCTVPFLCKKCVQACPTIVFFIERVISFEERLREVDPRINGTYKIEVARRDKCIACSDCVDICTVGAIKIEGPWSPAANLPPAA